MNQKFTTVTVQILALKRGELHQIALPCGLSVLRRHARPVAGRLFPAPRVLLLQERQLALNLADLLCAVPQYLQLVRLELILGAFNGAEQEVSVVAAILNHGRALVCGQDDLLHQILVQLGRLFHGLRLHRHQ